MTEQQQHPSSPSQELRKQWMDEVRGTYYPDFQHLIDRATRWAWDQREPEIQAAADAELEACCEWFAGARNHGIGNNYGKFISTKIRAARRPKPPSLKEQALGLFKHRELHRDMVFNPQDVNTILHALEALPDG
jgi:hypothetical protein